MTGRIFPNTHQYNSLAAANPLKSQSIQQAQELIYKFLIYLVRNSAPETVILELNNLFSLCKNTDNSDVIDALYEIIFSKNEELFRNTLKRSCYILINNWYSHRKYTYIQELILLFDSASVSKKTLSRSLSRLRIWLTNFMDSEDYQELKLFASMYTVQEAGCWSHRYTSFLLVPQYLDSKNPTEQREIARSLSKLLKEKFTFELAMYAARCDSPTFKEGRFSLSTSIGHEVICLIKKVVPRQILFSHENYAHLFIKQIQTLNYGDFKESLKKYLVFSINDPKSLEILNAKLLEKLDGVYQSHSQEILSVDLLLRTCRRLIDFLTTEDGKNPSSLFILITTQGSTLTLVIIFLKIILICKYVRTHLEFCIAQLIHYYEKYPESECQWFINFLEIFNIVFAIYTENIQYNLVIVKDNALDNQSFVDLDAYRVFPQLKGADLRGTDLSGADLRSTDLSAANLRGANLSGADLSHADLSLAKLTSANLSSAMLTNAELVAADLKSADLHGASLNGADMRCVDLRQANLSSASLIATKLRRAVLQNADMRRAILSRTSLNACDLRGADLQHTDLQHSDLSEANLSYVDLSDANLSGADLRHTKLHYANLSGANLHHANLSGANLTGANLTNANLNCAELDHVNLRGANLSGAILRCATISDANLSSADLSHADLSHADLSYGELSGTDLSNTFLRHVNLRGADLSDANLSGANLFSTNLKSTKVKCAQFKKNSGLPKGANLDLEARGAIFEF